MSEALPSWHRCHYRVDLDQRLVEGRRSYGSNPRPSYCWKVLSVKVPPDLHGRVGLAAAQRGQTQSEWLRDALGAHLRSQGLLPPPA